MWNVGPKLLKQHKMRLLLIYLLKKSGPHNFAITNRVAGSFWGNSEQKHATCSMPSVEVGQHVVPTQKWDDCVCECCVRPIKTALEGCAIDRSRHSNTTAKSL